MLLLAQLKRHDSHLAEAVRAFQERKLEEIVGYRYRDVSYYRERVKRLGFYRPKRCRAGNPIRHDQDQPLHLRTRAKVLWWQEGRAGLDFRRDPGSVDILVLQGG
jgi:hypothetical protein